MSDTKISALPSASSLTGAERLPVSQSNQTRGATTLQQAQFTTGIWNVKWSGAVGDGVTDDTSAINAAIAHGNPNGAAIYLPAGTYKITSSLTTITGQFTMFGDGPYQSTILFVPSGADTCIEVNNGASRAERVHLRDFAIKSTDTTNTKVALDLYDLSICSFERLFIYGTGGSGPSAGVCWSGSNSIGIRTHGREATFLKGIEIIADKPVVIAANPNTSATNGEDMDHWHWEDLYLIGNGNYLIAVDNGLGLMETTFDGFQAWVAGTGGFKINDTRVAPTIPSRGIKFKNVRYEQGTDSAGYAFNLTFTQPVQNFKIENALMSNGVNGITITGFDRMVLEQVTGAATSGTSLVTAGATSSSVLVMRGCIWTTGGAVTLTGLTQIHAQAYRSASYAAPSDAVYAGQITDTQLNVAKVRATSANAAVAIVATGTTGDGFQVLPQAAASGVTLRAVNNAENDFTPMAFVGSTFDLQYRTGAATSASAADINTSGQLSLVTKIYPGTDAAAKQAVAGIYAGNGAPNNSNGANGDFYFRGDGTQAGNTVIYHKQSGSWVALITT